MKVMFVCDVFPYPPHEGSSVISYHWIRGLACNHAIFVLSLEGPVNETALGKLADLGVTALKSVLPGKRRSLSIRGGLSRFPMAFGSFDVVSLRKRIQSYVEAASIDVVVLVGPILSALFVTRAKWPCPVLLVPFDSVSFNLRSRLHFFLQPPNWRIAQALGQNGGRLLHYFAELLKWARLEREVYPRASGCVAVTTVDAAHISRQWPAERRERMHIIPLGVDVEHFQPNWGAVKERRLVFSGKIRSLESAGSALWFMERVFPEVKRCLPDVSLDIVGKDPPAIVRERAESIVGIRVTGFVPDIRPFVGAAAVYVSPTVLGSGMKTRVLEALAMGRAVVATADSCRGLNIVPGKTIVVADDRQSFQRSIVDLVQDPSRQAAMGHAARGAVERSHSWELITEQVEKLLENVCGSCVSRS